MTVDCVIIGQGICGTMLSYELLKHGLQVMVIDNAQERTASRVASGLINPVTGKRAVQAWMIEKCMDAAIAAYEDIGDIIGSNIISRFDMLDFHETGDVYTVFSDRIAASAYLSEEHESSWSTYFNYHFGIGCISPVYLVDLPILLGKWRKYLQETGRLLHMQFDWAECEISNERIDCHDIQARYIISCEGVGGFDNGWFDKLAYTFNKGEILLASIPGLPRTHLYKQGVKIIPWNDDLFWIGASYDWNDVAPVPTEAFRNKTEKHLSQWLKQSFDIRAHEAALRPASADYRPFVGFHPLMPSVGILNGMGSKGCSQAPYFAAQIADCIVHGKPILADADINRYRRVLSR